MTVGSQAWTGSRQVEIRTVGGELVAGVSIKAEETVGSLKQRVMKGVRTQLVCGLSVLADCQPLGDCALQESQVMTVVCKGPSQLAQQLGASSQITDLVDDVLRSECETSAKYQPSALGVTRGIPAEARQQLVGWFGVVCDAMMMDPWLLHSAILTLDRFAARGLAPLDQEVLLRYSLAALCTELKLTVSDDCPQGCWQRMLQHLAQGRVTLTAVLEAEVRMLFSLDFIVGLPTPYRFLQSLGAHHSKTVKLIARLLVELALFDVDLQYRYPAPILAAAAIGAAIHTDWDYDAHEQLVEDVGCYTNTGDLLRNCEHDLLLFWRDCVDGRIASYGQLCMRHARPQGSSDTGLGAAVLELRAKEGLANFYALQGNLLEKHQGDQTLVNI